MGRKRTRTRKHLYLSLAGIIFLSFAGCATWKGIEAKMEANESLVKAQELLAQGDYEGSLKENQKILSLNANAPPGDEALFNMGLIYAHYGYPERDYKRSLDLFKRMVKVFPQSPLAGQARIWMEIIQHNERLSREAGELDKSLKKSQQETEKLNREVGELDKSLKKSQQENEKLNRKIEELTTTIKKSKQVDIEIDEKKKELSR